MLFETDRLVVRELTINDIKQIFKLSREDSMKKWLPDQVYRDLEHTEEVIRYLMSSYNNDSMKYPYVLAIELKSTGECIGHVGLSEISEDIEIGYAIGQEYQKNGYASEAVRAFSRYAIEDLKITPIYGVVKKDNIASCKTLERSLFNLQGKRNDRKIYVLET